MSELPIAPIARIMKRHADDMKISKEAKEALAEALEQEGLRISETAVHLAEQDGRKTVMAKDIKRWVSLDEMEDDDFIYKDDEWVRYNKAAPASCFVNKECFKALPTKFLKGTLLFHGRLYNGIETMNDAKRLMESHKKEILDSLMEPHWAYNIYEFRDWEPVKELDNGVMKLEMWFDDYDGGDVFVEGYLFQ